MKRGATLALAGLTLGVLVGCNDMIAGSWSTKEDNPPENAKHFTIGRITFEKSDGTYMYSSTASYGGSEQESKGTYSFDGMKLKLTSDTGKERSYGATYNSFNKTLSVTDNTEGRKTTVVLAKTE